MPQLVEERRREVRRSTISEFSEEAAAHDILGQASTEYWAANPRSSSCGSSSHAPRSPTVSPSY